VSYTREELMYGSSSLDPLVVLINRYTNRHGIFPIQVSIFLEGVVRNIVGRFTGCVWLYLVKKRKSMKWSDSEKLVLGRSLESLVVLIFPYKNSYGILPILVSMFGEFSEQ
jgi:hypothetical protein